MEKPYGHSLTSLAPGEEGRTIWSTALDGYDPPFSCHWDQRFAFGFHQGKHLVLDSTDGRILREQCRPVRRALSQVDLGQPASQ